MNSPLVIGIGIHERDRFPAAPEALDNGPIVCLQTGKGTVRIIQPGFHVGGVFSDLVETGFEIGVRHGEADKADLRLAARIEVLSPVKRNVAALYDQALPVLDHGFDHFPHDRPEIRGQRAVVLRPQRGIPAADEAHLQMVEGEIRIAVPFKHLLRQKCFPGMGRTGDQYDHGFFFSLSFNPRACFCSASCRPWPAWRSLSSAPDCASFPLRGFYTVHTSPGTALRSRSPL